MRPYRLMLLIALVLTSCAAPSEDAGTFVTATPSPAVAASPSASARPSTPATPSVAATPLAAAGPSATPGPKAKATKARVATASRVGPAGTVSMTGSKSVALTFDDGPDPVTTPKLLDALKAQGVKATFCLVGHRARDNQAVVARIWREGHTLCNHSWQHLEDLGQRPEKYLLSDLRNTNREILRAGPPGATIAYFRAPYGNFSPRLNRYAKQLGMTPIFWDVDDESYQTAAYGHGPAMVDHIVRHVKSQVRAGSIVLGHDLLKPFTVTAYQRLLPWLKGRFTLVALPATS
jgi:peptidoglycan/xylan/chitin deacetylase (PgdA/CDA1 family)